MVHIGRISIGLCVRVRGVLYIVVCSTVTYSLSVCVAARGMVYVYTLSYCSYVVTGIMSIWQLAV